MAHICYSYGFDMGYWLPYQTHTQLLFLLHSHSIVYCYGISTYFVKFHTFSIEYALGLVWVCPIPIPYDPGPGLWDFYVFRKVPQNSHRIWVCQHLQFHTKSTCQKLLSKVWEIYGILTKEKVPRGNPQSSSHISKGTRPQLAYTLEECI